ncbi:NfeD family protein [Helcococcus massiliensis]|uniref:NfeD family protein n=1 Tax=Helcococcus massiliensis TaxID=2040290 RepID=UPI000CDEDC90|nr:NfeD family protein [Helcococcus massiliensis]
MLKEFITNPVLFTLLLTIALTLVSIEIFVPGGIFGITGGYLIFESILAAGNIENVVMYVLISIFITLILDFILVKSFVKNMDTNKIVLNTNLSKAKGNGPNLDTKDLIGKMGIVNKTLRPYGEIEIEGKVYVATSYGNFIDKGDTVIVDNVEGSTLYCKINRR